DYSHLGSELYWDRCSRVRQELLMTRRNFMPEEDWVQFELDFMLGHRFHTDVAMQLFDVTKQKNIKQLRKYQQRIQPQEGEWEEEDKKKKKKKKKDLEVKELNLGRGVETMFRTTYRSHTNLSTIADNKANIMLSINGIIISIVVSSLVPKLGADLRLIIPTFVLLSVCLTTLVFAILASRPQVTKGSFTKDDIIKRKSNLLFFGNFYEMSVEDYHWGVMEMIKDSDFLYSSMTRDLYYLGVVLAKKYRLLRISYNVFMYGLIIAVLAFGIAFAL
nr:HD family phosphohydrolase [Haliscomenobacter sp.]